MVVVRDSAAGMQPASIGVSWLWLSVAAPNLITSCGCSKLWSQHGLCSVIQRWRPTT
jgi:hypothetical protein